MCIGKCVLRDGGGKCVRVEDELFFVVMQGIGDLVVKYGKTQGWWAACACVLVDIKHV